MLPRSAVRASQASSQLLSRRGFHTTSARLSSPYHYPEGPRSNIPFDPLAKWYPVKFWGFCGLGFGLPFIIAYWQLHKNH